MSLLPALGKALHKFIQLFYPLQKDQWILTLKSGFMTPVKILLNTFFKAASLGMLILYKTKNDVLSYVIQQPTWQRHAGARSNQDPRAFCVVQCCSPLSR